MRAGVSALGFIDDIPTSLLQPVAFEGLEYREDDLLLKQERQHAFILASGTRLAFLARYRDFHALYASDQRREAGELLVLLMSSNAAPKRFWCIMLVDAVTLLMGKRSPSHIRRPTKLIILPNRSVATGQRAGHSRAHEVLE